MLKKIFILSLIFSSLLFANVQQYLEKAVEEYNNENYRQAIQAAKVVLKEDPNNVMANYIVGLIFYGTNNIPYAIKYLEKIHESPDAPPGTLDTLYAAYVYGGFANKSLPYFTEEIKKRPDEEFVMLHYGMSLQYTGNYDEAVIMYKRILAQGVEDDMVKFNVGKMFVERKNYIDAKDMFQGINSTSAYYTQSQAYLDSLEYLLRPFKIYASFKASKNSNPTSLSKEAGDTIQSSDSLESIFMITSRDFVIGDKLIYSPQYLFYHINYAESFAEDNDYYSHLFKPIRLTYPLNNGYSLFGNAKFNLNYLDYEEYSKQYGIQMGINKITESGRLYSVSLGVDNYDYDSEDNIYNNGLKYDLKLSVNNLIENALNINLGVNYTLSFYDPTETSNSDSSTANKAKDSEYLAHSISADMMVPFSGVLKDFSLLSNVSYTKTDHPNTQTGDLYSSMAGLKLNKEYTDLGLILRYNVSRKYNANLDFGLQHTKSSSNYDSLNYSNNKVFVGLSYFY